MKIKRIIVFFLLIVATVLFVGCVDKKPSKELVFTVDSNVIYRVNEEDFQGFISVNAPSKEGHYFSTWDKIDETDTTITYEAKYELNSYKVQFIDEGTVISEQMVKYHQNAIAPTPRGKDKYEFVGWDKEFTNVSKDLKVYAQYKKLFEVRFYINRDLVDTQYVSEGNAAQAPTVEAPLGYEIKGWNADFSNITYNMEIHAILELKTYTIQYKDESGNVLSLEPSSYNINSGASITLPEGPEKEGFEFIGWFDGSNRVVTFFTQDAEDKVFIAKYQEVEVPKELEIPSDGTFTFTNIKKIPHSSGNGTFVYQPDFTGLTVPSTSVTQWTWSSLDESVAKISQWSSITIVSTGFAILKAVYNADPTIIGYAVIKTTPDGVFISSLEEANDKTKYTVTFIDKDGNTIKTEEVEKGKTATYPTPPTVAGLCFVGWSAENFNVESNMTIQANYIEGDYSFSGKTVSILGDSISTYKGYIPSSYPAFYPYPTADFGDVNQTWWMRVINNLGMKLLKNNSYSGSCVSSGTGDSSTSNEKRLKELFDGETIPDVIIIFMGANDCASSRIDSSLFKVSYQTMLNVLKAKASSSEIYLMTLPSTKLYTEENKEIYNQIIRDMAKNYELNLIELKDTFTKDNYSEYVVDSCHPNKAGMIKISEDVMKAMLKIKGVTYKK